MRNYSDTIFALATKKSKSAISVFRVSGKDTFNKVIKITKTKNIQKNRPKLTYIYDHNGNKVDQVVLTIFKSPKSYTGEDMAEISCHGSIAVINKISDTLLKSKLRIAEPGEFTKRALMNDKINLLQAEAINEVVNAETDNQRSIAIDNLGGRLGKYIGEINKKLTKLLADVEAIIDFSDEELPKNLINEIKEQKRNIVDILKKTIENSTLSKKIYTGYKITIIGKPNTGKSSFINFINNKEVSIVTKIPGTTTDLVTSSLEIGGDKYTFVDTAGIRKHKNVIEKIGIEKGLESAKKSDLNLVFLQNNEINSYKQIKNKIFIKSKYDKNKRKIKGVHNISNITGYGIKSLLNKISKKNQIPKNNEPIFSRERHLAGIKGALFYLNKAEIKEIDIFAENVRSSIKSLDTINQKFDIEKILDIIFSDFCIGK